jgi:beta-glucosidase
MHLLCTPSAACVFFLPLQLYEESLQDASGNYPGPATDVFWQFNTPAGLQSMLAYVSRRYQRPEVWVTENGVAVPGEANMTREAALDDGPRLEFLRWGAVIRRSFDWGTAQRQGP